MLLNNPKYHRLVKLQKETRWCPATVKVPTLTSTHCLAPKNTTIKLRKEQQVVFDSVKDYSVHLVEAPTGWGKTVLAVALMQAWGGRTLIVVHSLTLAHQFAKEVQKFAGIKPSFFCDGKQEQSGVFVITTHTSFRQKYKLFTGFDNIIFDEVDLMFTEKSLKAIVNIQAKRKFGFTGTTKVSYDECNNIEGGVLAKFWVKSIKGKNDNFKTPLKAIYYKKRKTEYFENKTKIHPTDWIEFRERLDDDIERKKEQLQYILENTSKGEYVLCLWDRVADVNAFYKAMKKRNITAYIQTGTMKKKDREEQLISFKKTGGYLCGQTATLNRGYDNTQLTKVFVLYPLKGENTVRQVVGRLLRHFKGKEAYIYDFVDSNLFFQWEKRRAIYEKFFKGVPILKK